MPVPFLSRHDRVTYSHQVSRQAEAGADTVPVRYAASRHAIKSEIGRSPAARGEPGVEIYSYHRGEDNTYRFFALMADVEPMQHHGRGAMRSAMSAFGPLVAALGLDL